MAFDTVFPFTIAEITQAHRCFKSFFHPMVPWYHRRIRTLHPVLNLHRRLRLPLKPLSPQETPLLKVGFLE